MQEKFCQLKMWLTGQNSQNMKIAKSGQIMDKMLKNFTHLGSFWKSFDHHVILTTFSHFWWSGLFQIFCQFLQIWVMHYNCLAVLSCLKFWTIFTILVHMGTLTILSGVTGLWCCVTRLVPGTNMSETGTKADGTRDQIIFNVVHNCKNFKWLSGAKASQDLLKKVITDVRALFFKISPKISLNEVKNGQWKFWYHLEKLYSGTMKYFWHGT